MLSDKATTGSRIPALPRYPLWCHFLDSECPKKSEQKWERSRENAKRATSQKSVFQSGYSLPSSHKSEMFCHSTHLPEHAYRILCVLRHVKQSSKRSCREGFKSRTISCKTSFIQVYFVTSFTTSKSRSANKVFIRDSFYNDIDPLRYLDKINFYCVLLISI